MKPLDVDGIVDAMKRHKQVIVIEEHVPQGGLAAQTKQSPGIVHASCRLETFTLKDAFIHNYGSWEDLLGSHGLSPARILAGVS